MKQITVFTKIMTDNPLEDDKRALRLIQLLVGDAASIRLLDYFSNYEAGGYFAIYEIKRSKDGGSMYVCAFLNERHIANALDPRIKEEIELGNLWKITGVFSAKGEVKMHDEIKSMTIDGDAYYLYLLSSKR